MILYDFNDSSPIDDWLVINDGVMGGLSKANFTIEEDGVAKFKGEVSLENYGGFSSVRYRFRRLDVSSFTHIVIHLKGDGKRYQFRVKSDYSDRHAYITYFETSGSWEEISIPLSELYPTFRGRKLAIPDFPGGDMVEIGLLIGNKKAEEFQIELDKIELR